MAKASANTASAKERYSELTTNRTEAESRAKKCTKVSIPSLYVDPKVKTQSYTTPVQGTGARCVNAMANALLLAVLPPNISPMTLRPNLADSETVMEQAGIQKGELETALSEIERAAMDELEADIQIRAVLAEGFKHTCAVGSWLLYIPDEGSAKLYPLTTFVNEVDGLGNVLEIITLDKIAIRLLPDDVRNKLMGQVSEGERNKRMNEDAELYTHIQRSESGEEWEVYQEVEGNIVSGSEGSYPIDACPWIVVSLPKPTTEDYSRPLIEDYRGEFETLEALRKAIRKGAAAAAKILWFLKPTSPMKPEQITRAESGAVIRGNATDLEAMTLNKVHDLNFVKQEADSLARNLELAFGVGTAIQRQGERVTREEIQYLARTLEDARAGIYSSVGTNLMLPIFRRTLDRMQASGAIPEMPEGLVQPRITVGIASLGRGHDFDKLVRFGEAAKQMVGEEEFKRRVDAGELLARLGAAGDISTKGLVLDPETVQNNDTNASMQQAAVRAAPQMAQMAMAPQDPTGGM